MRISALGSLDLVSSELGLDIHLTQVSHTPLYTL